MPISREAAEGSDFTWQYNEVTTSHWALPPRLLSACKRISGLQPEMLADISIKMRMIPNDNEIFFIHLVAY